MNLSEVKTKTITELVEIAEKLGLEDVGRLKKQDIIFQILKSKQMMALIYSVGSPRNPKRWFWLFKSAEGSYCVGPMIFTSHQVK